MSQICRLSLHVARNSPEFFCAKHHRSGLARVHRDDAHSLANPTRSKAVEPAALAVCACHVDPRRELRISREDHRKAPGKADAGSCRRRRDSIQDHWQRQGFSENYSAVRGFTRDSRLDVATAGPRSECLQLRQPRPQGNVLARRSTRSAPHLCIIHADNDLAADARNDGEFLLAGVMSTIRKGCGRC